MRVSLSSLPGSSFLLAGLMIMGFSIPAQADWSTLFSLGVQDDSSGEFGDPTYNSNPAPGSATVRDDDFYTGSESILNYEEAVTQGDPVNRLHFTLNATQAAGTSRFRLTFSTAWATWNGDLYGQHTFTVKMNGQTLGTRTVRYASTVNFTVNAAQGLPVVGDNVIEISLTSPAFYLNGAWIGFDHVMLEVNPTALVDADSDSMPQYWEQENSLSDSDGSDAIKDPDHDNLTNAQEWVKQTKAQIADTDADGLKDGQETTTNPTLLDTDGDSLSDGAEVSGTPASNPLLADSDGDLADDAWEVRTGHNPASNSSTPPTTPFAFGVHFMCSDSPETDLKPREVAGFAPQRNWNNSNLMYNWQTQAGDNSDIVSPIASAAAYDTGVSSPITLAFTANYVWMSGNGGSPNQKVMDGYLGINDDTPASVTLSGIPFTSYDVLVYVGAAYENEQGYARLNNNSTTDKYFASSSGRPIASFNEPYGSTAEHPWQGNLIRFRNVTGSSCNVKVLRAVGSDVGLHAVQIVANNVDTDNDGMPNWWEFSHKFNPKLLSDASADADGDTLTNLQEFTKGTNPNAADTDGDGLNDKVETGSLNYVSASNTGSSPFITDTDGDGLSDYAEVTMKPAALNPNLADTDGDGRTDPDEVEGRTNPLVSDAANAFMPVVTTSPRTFDWTLNNAQLVWNHDRAHPVNNEWGARDLFMASVSNTIMDSWDQSLKVGLMVINEKVVYYFHTGWGGAFSHPDNDAWDITECDWSANVNIMSQLGFSGHGTYDISDRLRFKISGTSPGSRTNWTVTFELKNLDTNTVIKTFTFTGCALASNVHSNSASWQNRWEEANRPDFDLLTGVDLFINSTPLENTTGFAAWKDTDEDGMTDVWEDAFNFNKNSATDAPLDADTDGATNLKEFLSGTHPRNADTDGDNVKDGAELNSGSNPLLASSKPAYYHGLPSGVAGEDLNGNGLKDGWESYFGSFGFNGNLDNDGDGLTNAQENVAGTDPRDPKSRFWSDTMRNGTDLTLRWPRLLHKQHKVWQSSSLETWSTVTGTPSVVSGEFRQTIPNALGGAPKFFRASVNDLDTDSDGVTDWTEQMVLGSSITNANSLHAAQPLDANADGIAESTTTGDYAALLEHFQGSTATGGFSNGSGSTGSAGTGISRPQAGRFLMQAAFGPTMPEIDEVINLGYGSWITQQIAKQPTLHSTYIKGIYADYFGPKADSTYLASETDNFIFGNNMMTTFARSTIQGEDQLRQRVAFALSQIIVTSRRDANLENNALGMADFYDIFVRQAFGNYQDILMEVAMHPCMGRYLSHVGNQKANPAINQYPDENFAREVMQLFTIGLWQLNLDGTRKVNAQGQNIPTYSNAEITQMARVFTGLWFGGMHWGYGGWSDADYANPMTMHPERHDFGPKTLLNNFTLPQRAQTKEEGNRDIADAIRHLVEHPNCAPFIGKQLIQFLVTDNPSPAYVQRVASKFVDNGSGVRGDLSTVIRTILLDPEARETDQSISGTSKGRLKEPVIRTMAMARAFGMKDVPNFLWWDWGDYFAATRQEPTYSPSVFNFFRPEYRAAGLLTENNLAGPVFQITDSYSAIATPNEFWDIFQDGFNVWETYYFTLDLSEEAALANTPELLLDRLNILFCGGQMTAASRTIILNAITQIPAGQPLARARVAAYLMNVAPEGAVMR